MTSNPEVGIGALVTSGLPTTRREPLVCLLNEGNKLDRLAPQIETPNQASSLDSRIDRVRVVLAPCDQGGVNECIEHLNRKVVPVRSQGRAEDKRGDHCGAEQ